GSAAFACRPRAAGLVIAAFGTAFAAKALATLARTGSAGSRAARAGATRAIGVACAVARTTGFAVALGRTAGLAATAGAIALGLGAALACSRLVGADAFHHFSARGLGGRLHHVTAGRLARAAPDGLAAHGDRLCLLSVLGTK